MMIICMKHVMVTIISLTVIKLDVEFITLLTSVSCHTQSETFRYHKQFVTPKV